MSHRYPTEKNSIKAKKKRKSEKTKATRPNGKRQPGKYRDNPKEPPKMILDN